MDKRGIGVFDSGLGGLTAVKEIKKRLPCEDIVYFGDTGRVPYGTRSKETIIKYSRNDINFLLSKDVKIIVIACGTASSAALPEICGDYKVPIIGVVESASKEATEATKNGKIGIIGTGGTIKSGSYEKLIHSIAPGVAIFKKACPLFVPLVENGHFDTEVARLITEEYLTEIKEAGVDTLILGCTHYPLLKKTISEFMGENVTMIDAGAEVAKRLERVISEKGMETEKTEKGRCRYYVSDNVDGFETLGGMFLSEKIDGLVEKIDIERY